ncbi:MAG: hypothetical protein J5846_07130 [Desulfovibrio sp.]|nr:hypothetical protein [Desulfovibrio sp.]
MEHFFRSVRLRAASEERVGGACFFLRIRNHLFGDFEGGTKDERQVGRAFGAIRDGFAMMQKNVEKALSAAREAFRKISGSSKELGQMKIMQICPGFSCAACGRQVAG